MDRSSNKFKPELSDQAKAAISEFSGVEWYILFKMSRVRATKTIGEDDLLTGLEKNRKGEAKSALGELFRNNLLRRKPHTGCKFVYSADPHSVYFKDGTVYNEIFNLMKNDPVFKLALINDKAMETEVEADPGIVRAIGAMLDNKKGSVIHDYKIISSPKPNNDDETNESIIVGIVFICPKRSKEQTGCTQEIVFEVHGVAGLYTAEEMMKCSVCNQYHTVYLKGQIL